jgi:hypothetical protein
MSQLAYSSCMATKSAVRIPYRAAIPSSASSRAIAEFCPTFAVHVCREPGLDRRGLSAHGP